MKRWEDFNRIFHDNKTAEEQANEMIEYRRTSDDFGLPKSEQDIEKLRLTMLNWLEEEIDPETKQVIRRQNDG